MEDTNGPRRRRGGGRFDRDLVDAGRGHDADAGAYGPRSSGEVVTDGTVAGTPTLPPRSTASTLSA